MSMNGTIHLTSSDQKTGWYYTSPSLPMSSILKIYPAHYMSSLSIPVVYNCCCPVSGIHYPSLGLFFWLFKYVQSAYMMVSFNCQLDLVWNHQGRQSP